MPLFSVIIPIYKVERYLQLCVNSILKQSFIDYELILIDDGSTDSCGAMCDAYSEIDERVIVMHKENGGVSSARNGGIEAATGSWIWFVDGDDYIEPRSLEQLNNAIRIDSSGLYIFNCKGVYEKYNGNLESFLNKYYFTYVLGFGPWNKLYNVGIIKNTHLRFDVQESIGEDLLFNVQYYIALFSGEKPAEVSFLGQDYYHYVDRDGSAMNTPSKQRFYQQLRLYDKLRIDLLPAVKEEVVLYVFLLHIIAGIRQAKSSGFTVDEFANYSSWSKYSDEIKGCKQVVSRLIENENASLLGRIRIRLFVKLLDYREYRLAGILMGLRI